MGQLRIPFCSKVIASVLMEYPFRAKPSLTNLTCSIILLSDHAFRMIIKNQYCALSITLFGGWFISGWAVHCVKVTIST